MTTQPKPHTAMAKPSLRANTLSPGKYRALSALSSADCYSKDEGSAKCSIEWRLQLEDTFYVREIVGTRKSADVCRSVSRPGLASSTSRKVRNW